MKIKLDKTDSKVVKSNDTYDVIDNTNLNNLVVSKTILHPEKSTTGHNHKGQEEVYIFTKGKGTMIVGEKTYQVEKNDIVLIPDGDFHKVFNIGKYELGGESIATNLNDLEFICVFNGGNASTVSKGS